MPLVKMLDRDKTTMDRLWLKIQEMDVKLIHINGSKMPADALSRQPRQPLAPSKLAKKAQEDVIHNLVSSSTLKEAFPENMSTMQWRFEQGQDPTCKVIKKSG